MKQLHSAVLLVFAALVLSDSAQADDREAHGACKSDVQKLCKGVESGGGRIAACLKQHEAELSAGCKKRIAEAQEEGRELAQACKGDAEALCKDVQNKAAGRGENAAGLGVADLAGHSFILVWQSARSAADRCAETPVDATPLNLEPPLDLLIHCRLAEQFKVVHVMADPLPGLAE